ncbi:unnamed protein product, partial [Nesidiocoris tenuis]
MRKRLQTKLQNRRRRRNTRKSTDLTQNCHHLLSCSTDKSLIRRSRGSNSFILLISPIRQTAILDIFVQLGYSPNKTPAIRRASAIDNRRIKCFRGRSRPLVVRRSADQKAESFNIQEGLSHSVDWNRHEPMFKPSYNSPSAIAPVVPLLVRRIPEDPFPIQGFPRDPLYSLQPRTKDTEGPARWPSIRRGAARPDKRRFYTKRIQG